MILLVQGRIYHGTEALYNITESEIRGIEQIEEDQMRNIFQVKTGIQVPIHLMYLELGQVPARFKIQRFKLNFLQYILHQKQTSLLHQMLIAQKQNPVSGDWVSKVSKSLKDLGIGFDFEKI